MRVAGIRVPGIMHLPASISASIRPLGNINVTTPVGALDVLPTIMDLLGVNFKTVSRVRMFKNGTNKEGE